MTFGNPLGFVALLALPAIFAIHFLQRESRRVVTSTLFLLEQLAPESAQGRRFERLRNSAPLWLQILAALLVTWLLVQPRWLLGQSTQRVLIVLDSSVSMLPFQDELLRALDASTARLSASAAKTEWHLLETDTTRPTLYSSIDRAALLRAVASWKPHLGTHDISPALQLGQTLLRGNGTMIFATDRTGTLPAEVRLLAVGHPLENCGFAGATFDDREWRVLVRNYGRMAQRRSWWIEARGEKSPRQELALEPGQTIALTGSIPEGSDACELMLDGDAFTIDDRLPIVRTQAKRLQIAKAANSPFNEFCTQLIASLDAVDPVSAEADLQFSIYDPLSPRLPEKTSIVFLNDTAPSKNLFPGNVVAENHPLTADSNWSGLLCRETFSVPAKPGDQALVWQGERPLIFLRENGAVSLLVVNFDLRASNATRLPAFVLLLHRFAERVRAAKVAPETRNVETNQALSVAADSALPPPVINDEPADALRAPSQPSFFEVKQAGATLLRGAAHFADVREADFREAMSSDELTAVAARLVKQNSEADFLAPLSALLLACAMTASWLWRAS